jgi:hypothetical protein
MGPAQFVAMMEPERLPILPASGEIGVKAYHNTKLGLNYKKNGERAVVRYNGVFLQEYRNKRRGKERE